MFPFDDYMHGYDLCSQAVTVYREEGGSISRAVHERAYFDFKRTENVDKTGLEGASGFLLVIPGRELACRPGDKVFNGVGPEVPEDAAKWWRTFIPSKVDGLAIVKWADPKYWGGSMVHTEAGG